MAGVSEEAERWEGEGKKRLEGRMFGMSAEQK
jgi:hypothetical protein